MIKLFLDTNIYLDFYRSKAVNKLLKPLLKISDHILITNQVISEINRNKLELAISLLKDDINKLNLTSLPDALIQNAIDLDEKKAHLKSKRFIKHVS